VEVAVAYSRNFEEKLRKATSDLSRIFVVPAEILTGHIPNISNTRYRSIQVAGWKKQKGDKGNYGKRNKVKNKQKRGKRPRSRKPKQSREQDNTGCK
jgi:hypothetical protein